MNSFYLLLSTVLPGLAWLFLIYVTIPSRSADIRSGFKFFIAGVAATAFVSGFLTLVHGYYDLPVKKDADIFYLAFARVAPLEEVIKIVLFTWAAASIRVKTHPSALLAYGAVLGLGFATMENLSYATMYGSSVALMRSITSTVLHVGCGITFAWFYITSMYNQKWPRSRMSLYFNNHPKLRSRTYQALGLLCCVWIHGQYDYMLIGRQPLGNAITFLIMVVIATWGMARNLERKNVNNFNL